MSFLTQLPSKLLLGFIRLYQFTLSSVMGRQCRFYPTCSTYTAEAIRKFGAAKGSLMGVHRICRCHPCSRAGMILCRMPLKTLSAVIKPRVPPLKKDT